MRPNCLDIMMLKNKENTMTAPMIRRDEDPRRCTGRTTRMILNAADVARKGGNALCLFATHKEAENQLASALKMIEGSSRLRRHVITVGDGTIEFRCIDINLRGQRRPIAIDHAARSLQPEAAYEAGFAAWPLILDEFADPKQGERQCNQ